MYAVIPQKKGLNIAKLLDNNIPTIKIKKTKLNDQEACIRKIDLKSNMSNDTIVGKASTFHFSTNK